MSDVHVIPHKDIKKHVLFEWCLCNPQIKDGVVIHNAFDGREKIEIQLTNLGFNAGGWDVIDDR